METNDIIVISVVCSSAFILILILLRICFLNAPKNKLSPSMIGKIVIITGANSGIGKETAIDIISKGAIVVFACRNEEKTQNVINRLNFNRDNAYFMKLDLSNINSIISFVENFKKKFKKLDILINNAGALNLSYSFDNGIETTIMNNHIGPVILTSLLIECINDDGRIINLSSIAVKNVNRKILQKLYSNQINEQTYKGFESYSISKLGNMYHAQSLNNYFKKKGLNIKTCSLHPGVVNTEFFSGLNNKCVKSMLCILYPIWWFFTKDSKMGAQTTLYCTYLDSNNLDSGKYYSDCRIKKLDDFYYDENEIIEFMNYTKDLINSNFNSVPKELKEYLSL